MANSIIDDMLKEQMPNKNSKGKSSKIFIFLFILLMVVIILSVLGIIYLKKKNEITPKLKFLEYLGKGNLSTILNFETYNQLEEKMKNENSQTLTNMSLSCDSPFLELEDINLNVESNTDVINKKSYSEANLNYKESNIINLKMLASEDSIALKSDEIVSRYVGSKYENLGRILSKFIDNEEYKNYLDKIDIESLMNTRYSMPTVSQEVFAKYINIIAQNVEDASFNQKEVTLERKNGNIETIEYSMTVKESVMIKVLIQTLQTLQNDDELLDSLCSIFDNNIEVKEEIKETLKVYINNLINELYEKNVDDSKSYSIKVYAYNNQTLKLTIDLTSDITIDFDYEYNEKENSVVITTLNKNNNNGLTVTLKKNNSDISENIICVIDMVEDSEIIGELTFTLELLNSQTSYEIKNKIGLNFVVINLKLESNSKIDFKTITVEDLNESNCLFLDTLDDNTFNDVVDAISKQTNEVITNKLSDLSLINNDYSTVIEQPEIQTGNDEQARDVAKQKIIEYVSLEMKQAMDNGETYTLENLNSLQIPDSEYSISVNDNIAIIIIDGFEFTLDSDFNLSN